jgi:diadenosine tetraphosphatase ApaH/serine/threonine PP2A family protein phosphatase
MRLAVLSDIHANLEAFQKVLKDIDRADIDAVVSLGDNIGYGPDPNAVIDLLQQRRIPSAMGNHELAVVSPRHLGWFNPLARRSLRWTIERLSEPSRDFISRLPGVLTLYGLRFVHGFPPRAITTYLFQVSPQRILNTFQRLSEPLCFIGHTHDLEHLEYDGHDVARHPLREGGVALSPENRHILNIGAVGQPRDGDNRAKYVIWDSLEKVLTVRFVAYDIAKVVRKIKAAGLPEAHADRLW